MKRFIPHPATFIDWSDLGSPRPYLPNYSYDRDYIDQFHQMLSTCKRDGAKISIGIKGSLRREDALKLYELAFYASGDVLEFGTNHGLSAYILSTAIRNSGRQSEVITMELSEKLADTSRRNLEANDVGEIAKILVGDARLSCRALISGKRTFGFAFVDHSHSFSLVQDGCLLLPQLLAPGACVVFHDFNDKRNTRSRGSTDDPHDYGVYDAVRSYLPNQEFDFVGSYGCCGVYRRRTQIGE
jgi:predicted O-methyltransferase YrrM